MLRSMYSGISGMKNFQIKLDVVGNNIANVNTHGFKKGRVNFQDMMYQEMSGATAPGQGRGGVNPQQIGLGSTIATIDTIHTGGSTQSTGRTLDLALEGDGFFVVGSISDLTRVGIDRQGLTGDNKINGMINNAISLNYTRAGNFYLDEQGYLVNANGLYVIGQTGEKNTPTNAEVDLANTTITEAGIFDAVVAETKSLARKYREALNTALQTRNNYDAIQPEFQTATTRFEAAKVAIRELLNLDADATEQEIETKFAETDPKSENLKTAYDTFQSTRTAYQQVEGSSNSAKESLETALRILQDAKTAYDDQIVEFNVALGNVDGSSNTGFNVAVRNFNSITGDLSTQLLPNNLQPYGNIESDIDGSNSSANLTKAITDIQSAILFLNQNEANVDNLIAAANHLIEPHWTEELSTSAGLIQLPKTAKEFSIGADGTVTFVDSRGQLRVAGQLLLAKFDNNEGLQKVGDNLFMESNNSGTLDKNGNGLELDELFKPGSEGAALISSGTLEMSNVDLSEEFTEMIVAQRGFQANTRIITTSDEILQELVNLKR